MRLLAKMQNHSYCDEEPSENCYVDSLFRAHFHSDTSYSTIYVTLRYVALTRAEPPVSSWRNENTLDSFLHFGKVFGVEEVVFFSYYAQWAEDSLNVHSTCLLS